jgi:signal peptidase I
MTSTRRLRRSLRAAWLGLAVATLVLAGASHLGPALGYRLVIIDGGSMSPAIPLGAVVIESDAAPDALAEGQVVTVRSGSGALVTHRIARVVADGAPPRLELRGDANASSDDALVRVDAVVGVVSATVPLAGFALAFISMPSGFLTVVFALVALLFAGWWLDEGDERPGDEAIDPDTDPATDPDGGILDGLTA